ncbi:MAG TPA: HIT domain-containing protein [Anaerolineaceae bacterium]|nr:HIT domain-containing protein [Anaerolineaceae bacterium]HOH21471.1 HIT domain-containing protein [Anaerolineaceae bacterium]
MQHKHNPDCIFCTGPAEPDSPDNLIIHRGEHAYVMLNRFPYTSGHLMVVPFLHQPSLEGLEPAILAEIMGLLTHSMGVLRRVYRPEGFNMGANIGAAAGAGIAGHVHVHLVPRWSGDTNFMSAIGEARVVPEDLQETFQRLHSAWE